MLDFSTLKSATESLAQAVKAAKARPADLLARDASFQRFEYTFELCVKFLRRQLDAMSDSPNEVDALGYRDMIRLGVERGLVKGATAWFRYREMRNITSHVYNPVKAAKVFEVVPAFLRVRKRFVPRL